MPPEDSTSSENSSGTPSSTPEGDGQTDRDSVRSNGNVKRSDEDENPHVGSDIASNADSDRNSWIGYALAVVIVGTVVLGLLRPFYPTTAALALGAFLALFGVFVGLLAFRERGRES